MLRVARLPRRIGRVVQLADADHRSRVGQQIPDIPPHLRAAIGQIAHLAGHALRDPVLIASKSAPRDQRGRNASQLEAALAGDLLGWSPRA